MLGNQRVDFLGGLAVVEIAALQGPAFEKSAYQSQQDLQLVEFDKTDRLAIGLQGTESILFVHFAVVVQGAEDDFVVLRELLYLVECPQLIAFFKGKWDAGQKDEDLHHGVFEVQKYYFFLNLMCLILWPMAYDHGRLKPCICHSVSSLSTIVN